MTDERNMNQNDDESFGLPNIEYKPLYEFEERAVEEPIAQNIYNEEQNTQQEEYVVEHNLEEKNPSKLPLIIGIIVVLVVGISGFVFYEFAYLPKKEKQEQAAKEAELKAQEEQKAEEAQKAKEAEEAKLKQAAETKEPPKPVVGAIETISQSTGHYYVIISSSVDGDLAMDQAKKLSEKGVSSKIIPPFGKWKYYRLSIGDFDTFASAQSSADASKAEYGNELWVMKY